MILTPAKTGESGLATVPLPAVVHFNSSWGGGFGVLERAEGDSFQVWDSVNGSQRMHRDVFLSHWSGVIVIVGEPKETEVSGNPGLRRNLAASLSGRPRPPAVVGDPAARFVQGLFVALAVGLLAATILAQPPAARVTAGALAVLSAAGLAVTALMTVAISDYAGPFSPGLCRRGRFVDCESVLTSRFANFLGFPLSELGSAFYGAILLLLMAASVPGAPDAVAAAGVVFIFSIPVAVGLIGTQVLMRRICILCVAVHAVNITSAVVAWSYLTQRPPSPSRMLAPLMLLAMFFLLLLFFAIPYLKTSRSLARLSQTYRRMSRSPFASLAQLATEEPTDLEGADVGVRLDRSSASDELVVFIHPSCKQCGPVVREIRSLVPNRQIRLFVAVPPKAPTDGERRMCEAVIAAGLAGGPEAMVAAYDAAKESFRDLLTDDPVARLASRLQVPLERLSEVAAEATRMTRAAEAFADRHVEGTPAVFVNSLPFRGPVAHLVTLLNQHDHLLPRRRDPEVSV